jgi:photosystem II stability/assembly factor-like uncharacterized protein
MGLDVGTAGTAMWVSEDHGETWMPPYSPAGLYMESRVWSLTSQPAWGSQVFAGTDGDGPPGSTGRLLRSDDYGETWTKLQREFGEVRAMILRPLEGKED